MLSLSHPLRHPIIVMCLLPFITFLLCTTAVDAHRKRNVVGGLVGSFEERNDGQEQQPVPEEIRPKADEYLGSAKPGTASFNASVYLSRLDKEFTARKQWILANSHEKRLIKYLLANYDVQWGRPVQDMTETMVVQFGLNLNQIMKLDEKNQILQLNVWQNFMWKDELLEWNETEFGGITDIRLPPDKIWTPDVKLYNFADERIQEKRDANALVYSSGIVYWLPQSVIKSSCNINITMFPYDIQECKLVWGSWTYETRRLNLTYYNNLTQMALEDFIDNPEWAIVENKAFYTNNWYDCCDAYYNRLVFLLKLRRNVAFYSYILIVPCVLLSSITLVLFWIPPESPAKMQLGMNIFIAFFLLLLLLADSTPPGSAQMPLLGMNIFVAFFLLLLLLADSTPPGSATLPLLGQYYCLNMILISLSTFLTVTVVHMYFRADKKGPLPRWIKLVMIDYAAKILCMPVEPVTYERLDSIKTDGKTFELLKDRYRTTCKHHHHRSRNDKHTDGLGREYASLSYAILALEADIRDIRNTIRNHINKNSERELKGKVAKEWKQVALIMDRMFFWIYLVTNIISIVVLIPRPQ